MDLQTLQTFLGWCVILNFAVMMYLFVVIVLAGDWIHRLHGRWFPMSREAFYLTMYAFLGVYKMLVIAFNVVPYLVLAFCL